MSFTMRNYMGTPFRHLDCCTVLLTVCSLREDLSRSADNAALPRLGSSLSGLVPCMVPFPNATTIELTNMELETSWD